MAWKEKISRCFGEGDVEFAGHSCEIERAVELLKSATSEGIGYSEYIAGIKQWLVSKNLTSDEIEKELKKVEDLKSYFNAD